MRPSSHLKTVRFPRFSFNLIQNQRFSNMSEKMEKVNVAGQEINEGTAHMYYDTKETVFYNKVQVLNRDLSIQVIKLFSEKRLEERRKVYEQKLAKYNQYNASGNNIVAPPREPKSSISILDALAASGLRSIRYLKEIPLASHVTINDISEAATKLAEENCMRNHVDMNRVRINLQDATSLMYQSREPQSQFDVIDLDPYGSAANFLDSAVQAVSEGGLLCVTCTDMTVLSGRYPEVCFSKYNSMPVRGKYVHEMSLRVLLHAIDTAANKYKRHIVPWLSLSVDFYVRVFVRVYESAAEVKNSCLRRCMLFQSEDSPTYFIQPLAQNSLNGNYAAARIQPSFQTEDISKYRIGGPFWQAPIHDQTVVDELLVRVRSFAESGNELEKQLFPIPTVQRMTGILTVISEELKDVPFYYSLPELASAVKCGVPQLQEFAAALQNLGYRLSQFHHEPSAVKTDAPNEVVSVACI